VGKIQHANVGNGDASVNSDVNQQQPTKAQRISLHLAISAAAEAKTLAPPPALINTQKNTLSALMVAISRQYAPSRLPLPPLHQRHRCRTLSLRLNANDPNLCAVAIVHDDSLIDVEHSVIKGFPSDNAV
jgi:hypothetical protein